MFTKSGTKIKFIAKLLFWVEAALSVLVGLFVMLGAFSLNINNQSVSLSGGVAVLVGILIIIFSLAGAYITSLILHSYGEIVDKAKDSNYLLTRIADHTKHLNANVLKMSDNMGPAPRENSKTPSAGDAPSFAPDHHV